eukprot:94419-Chlamydomonas_euryale.AAC.1
MRQAAAATRCRDAPGPDARAARAALRYAAVRRQLVVWRRLRGVCAPPVGLPRRRPQLHRGVIDPRLRQRRRRRCGRAGAADAQLARRLLLQRVL